MAGAVSRGPTGQAGKARLTAGPPLPQTARLPAVRMCASACLFPSPRMGLTAALTQPAGSTPRRKPEVLLWGPIPRPRGSRPLRRQPDKTLVPTSSLGGEHLAVPPLEQPGTGAGGCLRAPCPRSPGPPPSKSRPIPSSSAFPTRLWFCLPSHSSRSLPFFVSPPQPFYSVFVWASLSLSLPLLISLPRSPKPSLSPPPSPS